MKKIVLFAIVLLFATNTSAQFKYPATPMIEVSDTLWGIVYKDNYRWLENVKDPKVDMWFKKQADFTNSVMSEVAGKKELIAEWDKLEKLQPPVSFSVRESNGRYFFQKLMPSDKVPKVFYRENINAPDQLLFDPMTFIKDQVISVDAVTPSYDGKRLLISYMSQGDEIYTIRVMDVDSKKLLPDVISGVDGAGGWTFDDNAFFYTWIKSTDNMDPNSRLSPKYKLHKLGTDPKSDIDFFSNESYPDLKMDPMVYPSVFMSTYNRNYIFATESTVQPEMKVYYAPIDQFNSGKIQWKIIAEPEDKIVRSLKVFNDKIYAITYKNAKNYCVVATDLKSPNWNDAEIVVPEKNMTLQEMLRSKDFLVLIYNDGINSFLYKFDPKTKKLNPLKLPIEGSVFTHLLSDDSNDFLMAITSWNKPYTEYIMNVETGAFSESPFNKPAQYPEAYKNLVVEEVEVKGHDGVMIPLSIIYKKGLKMDGSNICYMEGYGAYGFSMVPVFASRLYALAIKDVIIAFPHIRGGSEKGQAWYEGGFKTTKPNTWKDFISCGEYLISKGYTSKKKLAGSGTSAGGVLISRAITERPDLFAAALCNVGVANAMRTEFSANGPANIPEFGTVTNREESLALFEMDGMQHVQKGVKYPAVMCVAGWNDSRVAPWETGKFAAALQNASTSGKPILMKVNYDGGHFAIDKEVRWEDFANQYAFLMWQCGHPDFQLKKGK